LFQLGYKPQQYEPQRNLLPFRNQSRFNNKILQFSALKIEVSEDLLMNEQPRNQSSRGINDFAYSDNWGGMYVHLKF